MDARPSEVVWTLFFVSWAEGSFRAVNFFIKTILTYEPRYDTICAVQPRLVGSHVADSLGGDERSSGYDEDNDCAVPY